MSTGKSISLNLNNGVLTLIKIIHSISRIVLRFFQGRAQRPATPHIQLGGLYVLVVGKTETNPVLVSTGFKATLPSWASGILPVVFLEDTVAAAAAVAFLSWGFPLLFASAAAVSVSLILAEFVLN